MELVSHQTIRLSKGKHNTPEDGACVMELASMLAGEPFSDHPQSVCPVIGSFLRAYNDRIDDERRQDLYTYAAKVVGSRASEDVQHARAERLRAWALELHSSRWIRRLVPARFRALVPTPPAELVGSHAVCAIPQHNDETHAEALALIDELLTIGACKQPAAGRACELTSLPLPLVSRGHVACDGLTGRSPLPARAARAGLLGQTASLSATSGRRHGQSAVNCDRRARYEAGGR